MVKKKKKRRAKDKGRFEALAYVKQLEKKMGGKEEKPKKPVSDKVKVEDQKVLNIIKEAENELLTLKEKVDTKKLDKMLGEASDALSDGDPKAAKDLVDKLKDEIDKVVEHHIEKKFFDAEMLIIELEVVGIDVTSSKKVVEEGKQALKEKDLKKALMMAETASEEAEKLQRQQVMEVMTYAKLIIDPLKELDVDVSDFEKRVDEVIKSLDKKRFERAMELAITLADDLKSFRVQQFGKMVDQTKDIIMNKEKEGRDVVEAERMLKRALQAMDIKDFESASDYLIEARYVADKEAGLEFKAKAGLRNVKGRFEDLKKEGIFSVVAETHLRRAEDAIEKRDYNTALMEAKKAEGAIVTGTREHERITRRIHTINKNLAIAKELECNLTEAEALLDQTKESLNSGEFDIAMDFVSQGDEEIDRAIAMKAKTDMEDLVDVANNVKDKKAKGQLEEALGHVRKGRVEKGFALINKVKSRLAGAKEKITKLKDGIVGLQKALEDMATKGADITQMMDLIEKVQKHMLAGNFARARSSYYHAERLATQWASDEVYHTLSMAEDDLGAFERIGLFPAEMGEQLYDSWSSFVIGEKDRASELSSELQRSLTEYKEQYRDTMDTIQTAQERMHSASLMGMDVDGAAAALDQAFASVSDIDFTKGKEIALRTIDDLSDREETTLKDLRVSTKRLMVDMESNFPVPMARDRYNRAKALMDAGANYNAFMELSEASSRIVDLSGKLLNIDNEFEQVRSLLDQAEVMDIDVAAFKDLLKEAMMNKDTGQLNMAVSLVEQIRDDIQEIFGIRIGERERDLGTLVSESEDLDIDVEDIRKALEKGRELTRSKDFANAFNTICDAHKELVGIKERFDEASDAVSLFGTNIDRAEALGMDTTDIKEKMGRATEALSTGHFDEAFEAAIEGDSEVNSALAGLVNKKLEKVREQWIGMAERFEVDVTDIEHYLELASAERDDANYEDAIDNMGIGIGKAKEFIRIRLEARIEDVGEDIAKAREEGISPGPIVNLFDKANTLLDKEEFDEVAGHLSKINELLGEQRKMHGEAMAALEECERRIAQYTQEGVNLAKAQDSLDTAKGSMEAGEYDLAMDLISQSCDTADSLKGSYEKAKLAMEDTLTLIEELTDMDIDTIALTEEITTVYDKIDEGDYNDAVVVALDIREKAEDLRSTYFKDRIKEISGVLDEEASLGEDVSRLKELVEDIQNDFHGHRFEGLNAKIDSGHVMIAELRERFITETERMEGTERDIAVFEERGVIVLEARELLGKVKERLEARDYDPIDGLLEGSLLAAAKAETEKEEASEALTRCLDAADVPFEDIDIEHLASLSAGAHDKFDSGHYGETKVLATNAVEEAKRLQTEFVSASIADWESLKEQVEAEGVNTAPVVEPLEEATRLLKEGAFEAAHELCKEGKETIERLRKEYSDVNEVLGRLEQIVEETASISIPVDIAKQLIDDVKEAFTIPDYVAAVDLAEQGIDIVVADRDEFFTTLVAGTEGAIAEAKTEGVPVMRPEEQLTEGIGLLDNDQYIDAHRCLTEARETLEVWKERFTKIMDDLGDLLAEIGEAKEHGVRIEAAKEVSSGAKEALLEARFDDAEKDVDASRDALRQAWKDTASARMEECKIEIGKLEERAVPIDDIQDMFQGASTALEVNEFIDVLSICDTTMDLISAKMEEHAKAEMSIKRLRDALESVKTIPVELAPIWEALHGADHGLREGRLDEAEESSNRTLKELEELMNNFLTERIEKVQDQVDEALQTGLRSADLDFSVTAMEAITEKEYTTAWNILSKGEEALKDAMDAYANARGSLEKATNLVYEAEEEVDLSSALEFIEQANGALETGDYRSTMEMGDRAVSELMRSTKHYLEGLLSSTDLLIRRLELGGTVKLTSAERTREEAREALDREDLDGARALLKRCVKEAKRTRANYEIAKEVITALEEIFTADVINLHILKKGREKAKAAFERDYEAILESEEEIPPAVPMTAQLILQYQVKFEESVTIDIDVSRGQGLLDQAKMTMADHDYDGAVSLVQECYETVNQSEKMATIRILISMEEIMEELKDCSIDCSIQENLLVRAHEAVNRGETGRAFKYLHECNESLLRLKEEHKLTKDSLRHVETALFIAQHMGVDTQLASDLLASAVTMLEECDFESAKDMSRQGLEDVKRAKLDMVTVKLDEVKGILETAEREGVPIHRARHLLKKSEDLLTAEDFLRALNLAEKAEKHAIHMTEMHGDVKELVEATNDKIEYARTLGVDMGHIERLQARMNSVIAIGRHGKVKELSTEIESDLLSKIIELCNTYIRECMDKLREAENEGIEVDELRTQLNEAEQALDEEDFDQVLRRTNDLKVAVDTLVADEVGSRLERTKAQLKEVEGSDIRLPRAAKMMGTAEDHYNKGNYKGAMEVLGEIKEELRTERLKLVKGLIRSTEKMIKAGEKQRLDVYTARGFLDEASESLDRDDLEEAHDFVLQAYNGAKEVNMGFIDNILTTAKEVVEMAIELGGDTKRVGSFLSKTEELMEKENFDRAMFYAKQCSREVDRLQFKTIQGMINKLDGEMKADPEKDHSRAKELLEEARSALLTKKYDPAREYIQKCREEISKMKGEEVAKAPDEAPSDMLAQLEMEAAKIIAEAEDLLGELRKEGVDISELEGVHSQALEAMGEEDFVAAIDLAEQVTNGAREMKESIFGRPEEEVTEGGPAEEGGEEEERVMAPEGKPPELMALYNRVKTMVDDAAGLGIDVTTHQQGLQDIERSMEQGSHAEAEAALKDLDAKLTEVLGPTKDLEELVSEIDRFVTMATSYSFDVAQVQALYQQGLGLRQTDAAQAKAVLDQAKEAALRLLEGVYPYITVDLVKDKPFLSDNWNDTFIYISNTGNIFSKDLKLELEGADLDKEVLVERLDIGESKEIPVRIRPGGQGPQVLKIRITFVRDFDNRRYMAEFPQNITVQSGGADGPVA